MATAVPDEADVAAARQQIESADLAKPETVDALEGVRFTSAGENAARVVLASSASRDVLWAATWVYASSSTDPAPLQPLLQNADASIRTMAAAAVVAMGDRSGFAILASSLSDAHQLRGSRPPVTIGSFATHTLFRYVEAEGTPAEPESVEELPAAQTLWASWLQDHEGAVQFDASRGTWKLP